MLALSNEVDDRDRSACARVSSLAAREFGAGGCVEKRGRAPGESCEPTVEESVTPESRVRVRSWSA